MRAFFFLCVQSWWKGNLVFLHHARQLVSRTLEHRFIIELKMIGCRLFASARVPTNDESRETVYAPHCARVTRHTSPFVFWYKELFALSPNKLNKREKNEWKKVQNGSSRRRRHNNTTKRKKKILGKKKHRVQRFFFFFFMLVQWKWMLCTTSVGE